MKRITKLQPNQVFVFGSNDSGIHGLGAARDAHLYFNAKMGIGEGPTGQCYAIPTKDRRIITKSLDEIAHSAEKFKVYAEANHQMQFILTPIGCGLAGFLPSQIGPMFKGSPANVIICDEFKPFI